MHENVSITGVNKACHIRHALILIKYHRTVRKVDAIIQAKNLYRNDSFVSSAIQEHKPF